MAIYRLHDTLPVFPDPSEAEPDGLLAVGGDLQPWRMIAAYESGIFPWYSQESPILWWSPDPRCVLFPEELHVSRSMARIMRRQEFELSFDLAFESVIEGCASGRQDHRGAWLVPEMIEAYTRLHHLGLAHSVEAWRNGELVGGIYGLALGRVFFGESMFHKCPNASKAALVFLVENLRDMGFELIDCQQETAHLARFGARGIPRSEFIKLLKKGLEFPAPRGYWHELNNRPAGGGDGASLSSYS